MILSTVLYEIKRQPLISTISILGTAVAIFLVMVVFSIDNFQNVPTPPESNKDRIMYGRFLEMTYDEGSSSGSLSYRMAKDIYDGLQGAELVSYSSEGPKLPSVSGDDGRRHTMKVRATDDVFWKIYDFRFTEGEPFDKETAYSDSKCVILTRSAAETLVGKGSSPLGKEIAIDRVPYRITGVVEDINPALDRSHADGFITIGASGIINETWMDAFGEFTAILLARPGVSREDLAREVKARYATINSKYAKENKELIYHMQPHDSRMVNLEYGSNTDPDIEGDRRMSMIIYLVLLLLPAINLSSMTRSRLRHRVAEIGILRAFGSSRKRIILQLIGENFLVTLIGGAIGLTASILFIALASDSVYFFGEAGNTPDFSMLFSWESFLFAILFCFILNLLSASIPAWKATALSPADAIRGYRPGR